MSGQKVNIFSTLELPFFVVTIKFINEFGYEIITENFVF